MKENFKLIILFFTIAYMLVTIVFFNFYKNLSIQDTKQEAISILSTMNALRSYIENTQRPLIEKLKSEGKLDENFFSSKILSSSYITKNVYDILLANKKINYEYNLAAINPTNPSNKANAFEASILKKFQNKELDKYFAIQNENGTNYFYIALPTSRNRESCLECHGIPSVAPKAMIKKYGDQNGFYERTGDLRALISLKAPVGDIIKFHLKQFVIGGIAMFVVFVIFLLFIYALYKKEKTLQDKREKLLQNQNKLASMGEMINNIAHQWRQPLAQLSAILINIELRWGKDKLTKEILKDKIIEANEQISFMSNTIDDFRNFYLKNQHDKDFFINEIIEHVEHLVSASLNENKITLETIITDNFSLYGCPNDLTQVIINIINNAKDALVENKIKNKKIILKTHQEEKQKIISIEDNGGGIASDIMDKIFEPYFTTKHPSIGTGIGLYMCKTIVEKKSGGELKIKNSDRGALFEIIYKNDKIS